MALYFAINTQFSEILQKINQAEITLNQYFQNNHGVIFNDLEIVSCKNKYNF